MERIGLYAGSFDPVTLGHMDIIRRASTLFDRVVVAVIRNPHKTGCFSMEERVQMLNRCCAGLDNVAVETSEGLTTAYALHIGACAMIRGLRNETDFQSEQGLAQINRRICPQVETVFLMSEPEHSMVSSSAVRELASYGAPLDGFVPREIEAIVAARFGGQYHG